MQRTLVRELAAHAGERVRLAGWLHHQRPLSRVTFLLLRDASGIAQVVLDEPVEHEAESVLEIEGVAVASEQAPGGVEVHDASVRVISPAVAPPPVELRRPALKEQLPTQLDHAAVALRHPLKREIFELAARSVAGFRKALDAQGFVEIQTPKIVGMATESGANVFRLDYFGRDAFLAQSPQLYKQVMVGVLERVYEVGPVFRAEPHETARHLAEYVSLDVELGFIDDHFDVMRVARDAVAGMAEATDVVVPDEIPHVHFADAMAMLGEDEPDLAPAHERWLGDWALHEHGSEFLFVTGYPMSKRPFYTHPDPERPEFSNSFDLLFRGLELITGGQRLHLYEDHVAAIGDSDAYEWYLEAFRHGMPPHGGFAIGLERWVARVVGARNIRETTLFPRDRSRLTP